ncbi:helicase-exonuclease AddAB subunit AddA [Priestia koreensis]|uniref:helicase-exonuclease AddAB subunit AddA n=1 Tax=Priestia koreensis TaxID=284581 RepID=UPI00203BC457|nr:helicase-exonuclease AddAB subunit AddA [Priestia koreensis]MCM3004797.1 helicase-exonuclease AddAB subunit AddA [Priestia koreensis]
MTNDLMTKPANSQWTDDQWKAIASSGQDILVAAAAGSGKTAVLVERIITKVISEQDPLDVDRLLIVTFTNASAAEMRTRIGEALEKQLKSNPSSLHLRRQLSLLNRASISTLHSFCLDVIRKYYYAIDIDPGFRIADDAEAELIREEVLEELFEEEYSIEENSVFFDLIDRYTNDRSDADIQVIVRHLYEFSRSNPFPKQWLSQLINQYDVEEDTVIDSLPFIPFLLKEVSSQLKGIRALLEEGMNLTKLPEGPAPRAVNFEEDLAQIDRLRSASERSFTELHEEMQTLAFSRLKACKKGEYDAGLVEQAGDLRKKGKESLEKLQSELFARPVHAYMSDFSNMKPVVEKLVELVNSFAERYDAVKREKGLVDFSDLEHYCLLILREETEDGQLLPSAIGKKYRQQFKEVLVDEYQDTNMVQESLISLVTKDNEHEGNLFMVGDVKQSIYRFRLAEPFLFLSKYKRFTHEGRQGGMKIDLNKNFRSRSQVLDATNFIFNQVMDEEVGEISYDDDAALKLGASYPSVEGMETELALITKDKKGASDEESPDEGVFSEAELETSQLEARYMARRIKKMVQERFQIYDRKLDTTRSVTYRDFVILLRSMPWAPQIMEEFKEEGVPIYANLSTGYFDATEVSIMLSLLRVIDNPYQDIPLAAILRSPIVGLSEEDLATIRIANKKGLFYEAMQDFQRQADSAEQAELEEKVNLFYQQLQTWRTRARQDSLSSLIWQVYRDTGFYDFVGGLPGGKQRQANLRALHDRARQYEATSFRGLFRFLRFIERMQERGDDLGAARALGEQEDVVRLMTIHSSKGLEFPIVLVAGLSKQFNMMDLNKNYLLDKELGFGSKLINAKLRISYPTLLQQTIKRKMKNESLAEEMRVLYVALTRAKEKLILVGTVNDIEKSVTKWEAASASSKWVLPAHLRSGAKSYLDWVGPSLIRHPSIEHLAGERSSIVTTSPIYNDSSKWSIHLLHAQELEENLQAEQLQHEALLEAVEKGEKVDITSSFETEIHERMNWTYSHKEAANHYAKQSVSELKHQQLQDGTSDERFVRKFQGPVADRPSFMQEKTLTPAEKGTITHLVLQHIDLKADVSEESVRELVSSLITKEILTADQAEGVNIQNVVRFLESEIGSRLRQAPYVKRELPFRLGLKAEEIYPDWQGDTEETVLIQGVIDCLFRDEKGFVLVDFKTDNISERFNGDFNEAKPVLQERYQFQIDTYSKAIERILKQESIERCLYFLDGGYELYL